MIFFHHVLKINNWKAIVDEQCSLLENCPNHEYIRCDIEEDEMQLYELPTIKKVWEYAKKCNKNTPICYFHTKGVTKPDEEFSFQWRQSMNYWILEKWEKNLKNLKEYDTSGARFFDLTENDFHIPHYSGNFWWANSDYLKKLPDPEEYVKSNKVDYSADSSTPERYGCEFWIGSGHGKMGSVDNFFLKSHKDVHLIYGRSGKTKSFVATSNKNSMLKQFLNSFKN